MQKLRLKVNTPLNLFLVLIFSINCNFCSVNEETNIKNVDYAPRKNCTNNLFQNIKRNNIIKSFIDTSSCIDINNKCFCINKIFGNNDTLVAYFSSKDDSIFLIRPRDLEFNNPNEVLFFSLRLNKGDYYEYYDYDQLRDNFSSIGNLIAVDVLDIKIDENDTTYFFYHSSLPSARGGPFPEKRRYFLMSTKYGFLDYYVENIGSTEKLKFNW